MTAAAAWSHSGTPPKPSVGLKIISHRITSNPANPMAAIVYGRLDRRISSNCDLETASVPPTIAAEIVRSRFAHVVPMAYIAAMTTTRTTIAAQIHP